MRTAPPATAPPDITVRPDRAGPDSQRASGAGRTRLDPGIVTPAVGTPASIDRFVLFPARAFLAFGWLRASVEKIISVDWWTGAELRVFLGEQSNAMLPFVRPFTDALVLPFPAVTAAIVALVELALGVALLTGRKLGTALGVASALNVLFVLLGVVTPSAFYLVLQLTLLMALGVSRGWFTPTRNRVLAGMSGLAAVGLAPFIETVHPAEVIHDPAIMLATLASLIAATLGLRTLAEHLTPTNQLRSAG